MVQYTTASRNTITVGTLLGKGGQGEVFEVSGDRHRVAKIYWPKHRTPQIEYKLQAMLAKPPQDDTRRLAPPHVSIAWPLDVLYERQQFVGFVMPRIDQSPAIFTIFNPVLRSRRYPSFDWRYLHRTAGNLATAMNAFHARGYVVGDVNQKNVLVTSSAMVTWVDTDSFQVPDATGRNRGQVYRCPVGVPDYTPPELQGINLGTVDRSPEHDRFGLAVMIFQLLMQGYHPFTGVPLTGVATPTGEIFRHNIEQGVFPHQKNPQCAPPPAAPALTVLHPTLQQLFLRAFVDGYRNPSSRPSAREWMDGIGRAEQMLTQCPRDPRHWYSSHNGQCHWCAQRSQPKVAPPVQKPLAPAAQVQTTQRVWTQPTVQRPSIATLQSPPAATLQSNVASWRLILVCGIVQTIVGIMLLMNPFRVANVIGWAISLYWLVTGIYYLVSLIWDRRQWGWKLFSGIIGVTAGWFLVDADPIARVASFGFAIVLVLGIQGIIMGISGLIAAFQGGGWGAGIMGGISIVVGILLLGNMWAAALVLPWVIGIFAIVGGIFAVIMAFRLK